MWTKKNQTIFTAILLCFLTILAFQTRLNNFLNMQQKKASVDENIYYSLGRQIKSDFSEYNIKPYAEILSKEGKDLPDYFFQPIFKHPPLFSFFIATSMRVFGENWIAAQYVSLLFGVLIFPLVYLFGVLVFDRKIAALALIIIFFDPINTICSQRVWMDTTISFFMILSVYLFIRAIRFNNDFYFILSGISSGLAMNTKYTGVLTPFTILLYAIFYQKDLFVNKKYIISLFIPFIMLIPWFYWNYSIYGIDFLSTLTSIHSPTPGFLLNLLKYFIAGLFSVIAIFYLIKILGRYISIDTIGRSVKKFNIIEIGGFIIIALCCWKHAAIFDLFGLPTTSWSPIFYDESLTFYFRRILKFSPFYILSFISFFLSDEEYKNQNTMLTLFVIVIFIFFTFYRSYQSRYILSCIPILVLMASNFSIILFEKISEFESPIICISLKLLTVTFFIYSILKLYIINTSISNSGNFCYF